MMVEILRRDSGTARSTESLPKIALVGCGAIAESFYLPALANPPSAVSDLVLVDSNEARAQKLATALGGKSYLTDYREVLGEVDGAIIAAPDHLHYPISVDFLSHGVHVLCEKPLAESAAEAREMIEQSRRTGTTVSVNHTRRLFPSSRKVKELLAKGTIGNPLSIRYVEGDDFRWPTTSGFYFDCSSRASPKGVLLNIGSHVLDLICWWLGGKPKLVSSRNDSLGGCDAVAQVEFEHNGCVGEVKLSWLYKLQNRYMIEGESGTIEGSVHFWQSVTVKTVSGKEERVKLRSDERYYPDFGNTIVADFLGVIAKGKDPLVSGSDVLDSIEFIEQCYDNASRFAMPWYTTLEMLNGN